MKYELEIGIAIGSITTAIIFTILSQYVRPRVKPLTHDRWDSLLVSKLTKQGLDRNKTNFKSFTQSIYGWDKDDEGNMSPNWKEQDIIQLMKEMIEDKHSYASIARLLNNNGEKGKQGGQWQGQSVKRTVKNPFHDNINQFKRD
tara:strand:- start:3041 stop:3472 length:432 start_codon:yes stop_codon:yes gene_type:complete